MIAHNYLQIQFFDELEGLHGMHVHFSPPGVAADGEDVAGEADHGVAGGDGVHIVHVTATTCTEATSRTAGDSKISPCRPDPG